MTTSYLRHIPQIHKEKNLWTNPTSWDGHIVRELMEEVMPNGEKDLGYFQYVLFIDDVYPLVSILAHNFAALYKIFKLRTFTGNYSILLQVNGYQF
jgi:hypothetical protein